MKKEERKKVAEEIFEANPTINEVHVTSDGQAFTTENSGINHEMEISGKRQLNDVDLPVKFERQAKAEKADAPKKLTAEELIVKIGECTTKEEVEAVVGSDNRATVTKAAEAKIKEIEAAATAGGSEE